MRSGRLTTSAMVSVWVVIFAVILFIGLVQTRPRPEQRDNIAVSPSVEILLVEPVTFSQPIIGYGSVRPKRQVQVIPEVGGSLVESHPLLAAGNIIPQGELLYAIDARAYESKVAQVQAEIERLGAQLKRHQQNRADLVQRLDLAKQQAELARNSVTRERELLKKDSTTELELEKFQDRYLKQQEAVLAYQSQLAAIPILTEETSALLKLKQAQLGEAQLSVEKSRIYCPFDARVDRVTAQEPQVVVAGAVIASLTDIEAWEVAVAVDPRELRWLDGETFSNGGTQDRGTEPQAQVTWVAQDITHSWPGRVARVERLDQATRTAHIVIEIANDKTLLNGNLDHSVPSIGMFCRVEIPTKPLPDSLVVPRSAIRDSQFVYLVVPDEKDAGRGKLEMKQISILRRAGDVVLVGYEGEQSGDQVLHPDHGLQAGDQIITSPLPNPVEGMSLRLRTSTPDSDSVPLGSPVKDGES